MKEGMKLYVKQKSILEKMVATAVLSIYLLIFLPLTFESVLDFAGAGLGTLNVFRSTSNLDDLFEEISSIFLFDLRLPDALQKDISTVLMLLPDEVFFEDIFSSDLLLQSSFDRDL